MITDTDLYKIAKEHKIPLIQVFMKDEPPSQIYQGGYIINLQDASLEQGGTHFVGLYIPLHQNVIAYMDSFGFPPSESTLNWIRMSSIRNFKLEWNKHQIQNVHSGGCGIYSLFFIDFMSRQPKFRPVEDSMKAFQKLFDDDTTQNLRILKRRARYYKNSEVL
jgi:hypothetical protein